MSQENVELMRRAWDAWNRGDSARVFAVFDAETVWDSSHYRDWPDDRYDGIAGVEHFLNEWLAVWDAYEVQVEEVLAAPDGRVVSLFRQRGKGRESGLGLDMAMALIATVSDGKITRVDTYDDRSEALHAAGLSE
jgi:ketosteroid isomerase-like protein